jgi:hypothetical protein
VQDPASRAQFRERVCQAEPKELFNAHRSGGSRFALRLATYLYRLARGLDAGSRFLRLTHVAESLDPFRR